jgi:multiple sugar transport system substrate-binding protein
MRDIAEFFTRKAGEKLAGQTLESNFYGIVLEGIKGGHTFRTLWESFIKNYGGDIIDAEGNPTFDRPENIEAIKMWRDLWKFSPPGTAEYSLIDIPTVMGNGIAVQTLAFSDFVMGIDVPGGSPFAGKFVYGPVPSAKDDGSRSVTAEPSAIVISKASKNPEATFLFIQWLSEKKQQDKLIEAGSGGVPIRQSSWAHPAIQGNANPVLYEAMRQTLDVAVGMPKMPKYYELLDALSGVVQEIGLGKLSPEDGAKKGQEEMLKICAKCTL